MTTTATNTTLRNTALKSGSPVTWTQYPTRGAAQGRERTGSFWALAPGPGAIWVRPDIPETGEPRVAIKVYRTLRRATGAFEAAAYDDDLTAAAP
jgi:hypothetical protein